MGDKENTLPSQLGASVTLEIPFWECNYCSHESERVAREDSEWVHHVCGMPVPENVAQTANEQLEKGEIDRGIVEHEANAAAQKIIPQLEETDRSQDTGSKQSGDEVESQ